MSKEELDRESRLQAEDAARYNEIPLEVEERTIQNIADHIRDAWWEGYAAGKASKS
jgi:hypothetical protein